MIAQILLFAITARAAASASGECIASESGGSAECSDHNVFIQSPVHVSMLASATADQNTATKDAPEEHGATTLLQVRHDLLSLLTRIKQSGATDAQVILLSAAIGVLFVTASVQFFGLSALVNLVYFAFYIALSSIMLFINRSLIHQKAFVHPVILVTMHMLTVTVLTRLLFYLRPGLFPPLQHMQTQCWRQQQEVWHSILLIAVFFAGSLVTENSAYFFAEMPILQMIKEAGIFFVALFAILLGLDNISHSRHPWLAVVVLGAAMCVKGQIHFSNVTALGVILQVAANVCNAARLTLQQKVLTLKLDPLSYMSLMGPCCLSVLTLPAIWAFWSHPGQLMAIRASCGTVALSCFLAVGLNFLVAMVVLRVSAVGFCLLGTVKNSFVIVWSCALLGVETSVCQVSGCFLIFGAVAVYSLVKDMEVKAKLQMQEDAKAAAFLADSDSAGDKVSEPETEAPSETASDQTPNAH